jgi:hypothetical protein
MKNFNDSIVNRTCDLPAFSAVPQPTAPPRTPMYYLLPPTKIMINAGKELLILNLKDYFLKHVIINNLNILPHIRPMKC